MKFISFFIIYTVTFILGLKEKPIAKTKLSQELLNQPEYIKNLEKKHLFESYNQLEKKPQVIITKETKVLYQVTEDFISYEVTTPYLSSLLNINSFHIDINKESIVIKAKVFTDNFYNKISLNNNIIF